MITAEELEDCDIFPKQYTPSCIIKTIFYSFAMILSCILMYSFYSGRDFVSLVTMESLSYSSRNYLNEKLALIDKKYDYKNKDQYELNYTQNISEFFVRKHINLNVACVIKNGTEGFGVFDLHNKLTDILTDSKEEMYIETRTDPHMAFYKRGFTYEKMTYADYLEKAQLDNRTLNYVINELDLGNVRPELPKILSESLQGKLFKQDLKLKSIYLTEGFDQIITPGHSETTEDFICLVTGEIDAMLVSSSGRKYVYPYRKEYGPINYSSVNFFRGDSSRFPLFPKADRIHVTITSGECFYVPSYWWMSIKTKSNSHFKFITIKFEGSSRYVEEIMKGITDNHL